MDGSHDVCVSLGDEGWKMDVRRKYDGVAGVEKVNDFEMSCQGLLPAYV